MHFPIWSRSFYKNLGSIFECPYRFSRTKICLSTTLIAPLLLNYPLVNTHRFFPFIFSINQSFICKRNYLFSCPHEYMASFQYLATSKYVSTFSTLFQTQDIKTFWAWNLESLISRTGSFVTLDRIRCCSVLERQHALGTRMVSWKYLVCFICHSLETKAFFIFYMYVFLLL